METVLYILAAIIPICTIAICYFMYQSGKAARNIPKIDKDYVSLLVQAELQRQKEKENRFSVFNNETEPIRRTCNAERCFCDGSCYGRQNNSFDHLLK